MIKMTEERETELRRKWAMMTADVIAKWHSKTDFRSTMETRPEVPTKGLYTLHKYLMSVGAKTTPHHRSSLCRASAEPPRERSASPSAV